MALPPVTEAAGWFHGTATVLSLRLDPLLRNVRLVPSYNKSFDRTYGAKSTPWQGFTGVRYV